MSIITVLVAIPMTSTYVSSFPSSETIRVTQASVVEAGSAPITIAVSSSASLGPVAIAERAARAVSATLIRSIEPNHVPGLESDFMASAIRARMSERTGIWLESNMVGGYQRGQRLGERQVVPDISGVHIARLVGSHR